MIPEGVVEQVRESADVVAIIGEYVPLRRTGADFRGPCPFHQGKRANFSVSPSRRMYHCFVCHETGDVFRFLMKRLGVDWPEAVRIAGEKSGIEVRQTERRAGPDPREPFWEVNGTAAEYFENILWSEPGGEAGRDYLRQREISRELAGEFGLGFAPGDHAAMRTHMRKLGFSDERMLQVGLLVQGDSDREPRPRFRGRLMFPIHDISGHVVGFGGRLIISGDIKYLNSPESPAFSKGRLLYNLHRGRSAVRRVDRVLLVEGYFDALRVASAGFEEVVAPLGTALTTTQAGLLRRYTRNAILVFDNDSAGLKATFRAGDELLRAGVSVRVVTLPPGEDPDSFVQHAGSAGLQRELDRSIDVFDRKIQILERGGWFSELQRKRKALDRLMPTIRATADPIMRDLYISRAAEASGVARSILERELDHNAAPPPPAQPAPAPRRAVPIRVRRGDRRQSDHTRGASAERELIRAMLNQRGWVEHIAERIGPDTFHDKRYRAIFEALLAQPEGGQAHELFSMLQHDAVEVLEELLEEGGAVHVDPRRTVDDSLARLSVRDMEMRLDEIGRLYPVASPAERDAMDEERQRIVAQIRESGMGTYKAVRTAGTRL